MPIRLTNQIVQNPATCLICSTTPTDVEGRILPMIDTEIDVNWGDNLYICSECLGIMAELSGWVEPGEIEALKQELIDYKRRLKKVTKLLTREKARNEAMLGGKRAIQELRARQEVKNRAREAA